MQQIVITGATGFTGSHVLETFRNSPNPEYAIVAACWDKSKLPGSFLGNTLIGDLTDKEYMNHLTSKADIICHNTAWTEMNGNDENSKKYFSPRLFLQSPLGPTPFRRSLYKRVVVESISLPI